MIQTTEELAILNYLRECKKDSTLFSNKEIYTAAKALGIKEKFARHIIIGSNKIAHGKYDISTLINTNIVENIVAIHPAVVTHKEMEKENYIPNVDPLFVHWGNYSDIFAIIKSKQFMPTFIVGASGNGKTMSVMQAAAKLKREVIRIQFSPETDESDLIGQYTLINGNTIFQHGPVVEAMKRGTILLLDEMDRGSHRASLALQSVVEGKPLLIKKTNEIIYPAEGFQIFATGNTKGNGSSDGKYVSAFIMDSAYLERFVINIEQLFPSLNIERKIIIRHMEKFKCVDEKFADTLVLWAETIRKAYESDAVDEFISTRRLCHVIQTYSIFNDQGKSVELCLNRFDEDTKQAFFELYDKVKPENANANETA